MAGAQHALSRLSPKRKAIAFSTAVLTFFVVH
jgi:hypothetical protein